MENFRLKVFRTVARHLNFRIAAEQLLLTQPAVTQQIKAIESELGVALFDRAGGKVILTVAGTTLLPFVERLSVLANEARDAVSSIANKNVGTLRLAASQTIGQYLLPHLIAAFLAENPLVTIDMTSGNTQQALDALSHADPSQRASLALIEGPPKRQDLRLTAFMEDHMVCVVPVAHEWAGQSISLAQLQKAIFVTRELGSGSRRIVEQALEAAGLRMRDLHIRMAFDTTEGLLTAVEADLGIAFVSRWAVRSQLALGTLQIANVRGLKLSRMFSFATPAGPEPIGLTGAFYRFVLERSEELAPRTTGRPKLAARQTGSRRT